MPFRRRGCPKLEARRLEAGGLSIEEGTIWTARENMIQNIGILGEHDSGRFPDMESLLFPNDMLTRACINLS